MLKRFINKYPYLSYSVFFSPVLIIISIATTGAGHGTSIVFRLLYPYTFIMLNFIPINNDIQNIVGISGFLLYPLYGVILTLCKEKAKAAIIIISVFHLAAFLIGFQLWKTSI